MNSNLKRQRGGQIGNQNARKHGFYSRVLDKKERQNIDLASSMEGIDEEITIIRVKLLSVLIKDPDNISLILRAIETLARLLRIKYHLRKHDGNQIKTAIGNVFREIALPLGVHLKADKPEEEPCIEMSSSSVHLDPIDQREEHKLALNLIKNIIE
jgi:hypothetical protein